MAPALGAILIGMLGYGSPAIAQSEGEQPQAEAVAVEPTSPAEPAAVTEPVAAGEPTAPAEPAPPAEPTSHLALQLAGWVTNTADNGDLPFIVIDKVTAEVFVFDAAGQLQGAGAALLGLARGDTSVPGIGDRELAAIKPEERTTPAGRYKASFGFAPGQTNVFWVDYATAVSLHPVVTTNRKEQRLQRLASPSAEDNRITFGCINVAKAFYDDVVVRTFDHKPGIVYILPEAEPLGEVFPTFNNQVVAAAEASQNLALAETSADATPLVVAAQASADLAQVENSADASHVALVESTTDASQVAPTAPAEAPPVEDELVVTSPEL